MNICPIDRDIDDRDSSADMLATASVNEAMQAAESDDEEIPVSSFIHLLCCEPRLISVSELTGHRK